MATPKNNRGLLFLVIVAGVVVVAVVGVAVDAVMKRLLVLLL